MLLIKNLSAGPGCTPCRCWAPCPPSIGYDKRILMISPPIQRFCGTGRGILGGEEEELPIQIVWWSSSSLVVSFSFKVNLRPPPPFHNKLGSPHDGRCRSRNRQRERISNDSDGRLRAAEQHGEGDTGIKKKSKNKSIKSVDQRGNNTAVANRNWPDDCEMSRVISVPFHFAIPFVIDWRPPLPATNISVFFLQSKNIARWFH